MSESQDSAQQGTKRCKIARPGSTIKRKNSIGTGDSAQTVKFGANRTIPLKVVCCRQTGANMYFEP